MMGYFIGDHILGIVAGVLTALAVHLVISPGMDMVLAMVAGMAIGMVVHLVLGAIMAPLLGMMPAMIQSYVICMYGGMLFAMRDAMAMGSITWRALGLVGAIFGLIVAFAISMYDRVFRITVFNAGE